MYKPSEAGTIGHFKTNVQLHRHENDVIYQYKGNKGKFCPFFMHVIYYGGKVICMTLL